MARRFARSPTARSWPLLAVRGAVLLVLLAIPIAAVPVRLAFGSTAASDLVRALQRMAAAQLIYALLFTLGVLL